MIHSPRPIVTPVVLFSRFEKWGRTDGQHVRNNDPDRPWLAEWINYNYFISVRKISGNSCIIAYTRWQLWQGNIYDPLDQLYHPANNNPYLH